MLQQTMPPVGQRQRPRPIMPVFQNQANPGQPGPMPMVPPKPGTANDLKPGFSGAPGGSIGLPPPQQSVMGSPMRNMTDGAMGGPQPMPQTTPMATQRPSGSTSLYPAVGGSNSTRPAHLGADNVAPGTRPPVQGGGATNPAWGPQNGVSPFNASAGATGIGEFQRFADNAYNESVRRLDPQFAEQQRSFEQDMVNRGIAPGTEAYDNARANFEQARNDAYATARSQADQMGLAAQQQSFGQGAVNSQGLRELLLGQMGADASRYGADRSASASMYNSNQAAQSAADRLRFDSQQGDFGNLMQLLGFGSGINAQNNSTIGQNNNANNQWFNQNYGMLGLFGGGGNPSNIDVTSPYNNQYNAQLNTSQYNQAQQNANNQMYAQLAAAMLCDRDAKDEIATVDPEDALKAVESIPLVCWSYKAGEDRAPHVGTYAQDFNKAIGLPPNTMIQTIDLFGALIGSVQALTARIKELEAA